MLCYLARDPRAPRLLSKSQQVRQIYLDMAADIEMADESNSLELDVVCDSRLVQPTNAYGSPLAGASSRRNQVPEEETASNVAALNRVVSFGFILYRYQISSA